MRGKIPFEKRNRSRRGISDLLLVVVPFLVTVFLVWKGFYKTAIFAAFIVMVFNLLGLEPEIFDGTAERLQRFISTIVAVVGCTSIFLYSFIHVLTHQLAFGGSEPFTLEEYLQWADWFQLTAAAAFILFYLALMFHCWNRNMKKNRHYRRNKRRGPLLEGPDGQKYWVPLDLDVALEIYSEISMSESIESIPRSLLCQRIADLMYEDFKRGLWRIDKPSHIKDEEWKEQYQSFWAGKAFSMFVTAVTLWLTNKQYEKAKVYADRMTEVAMKRGIGYQGIGEEADIFKVLELRKQVYDHVPEKDKNAELEQKYQEMLEKSKEEYEYRMQKYEADAPKRAARAAERQRQREEERLEQLEAEAERMEQEERQQQESSGSSYHSETDFSRMPSSIHSGGKTYRLYHNYGHSVEYVAADDPNDTVTITNVYSRTGSEITTNAGTFYL